MSLGLSRTYLGLLHGQPGVLNASSSRLAPHSSGLCRSKVIARTYAGGSASATKIKGPPTAKSTVKHLGMGSVATPKVRAKTSARTTPKTASAPAKAVAAIIDVAHPEIPHVSPIVSPGAVHQAEPTAEEKKMLDEEHQIQQIDQLLLMSRLMPTSDPWGHTIPETLDVIIPYPAGISSRNQYDSFKDLRQQFWKNRVNSAKNATSMLLLAANDSVPGVDLGESKITDKLFKWPFRLFGARSTTPDAWLTPFRSIALNTYKQYNAALAKQDDRVVKQLTTADQRNVALGLMKKNKEPHLSYVWRFHKEVEPTRVLSVRTTDGNMAEEDPKFGSRLVAHVLVKFDTLQSLEIYNKAGKSLHKPAHQHGKKDGIVPAEPKRVTEYFVLEKRMWYDGPWVFREQMWEVPRKKTPSV